MLAPPVYPSIIGRGSVGLEILCFLPPAEVMLGRVSLAPAGAFEPETLRLNHFEGFDKNCVKPEEGDVDREAAGEGGAFGLSESCVPVRLGAI